MESEQPSQPGEQPGQNLEEKWGQYLRTKIKIINRRIKDGILTCEDKQEIMIARRRYKNRIYQRIHRCGKNKQGTIEKLQRKLNDMYMKIHKLKEQATRVNSHLDSIQES